MHPARTLITQKLTVVFELTPCILHRTISVKHMLKDDAPAIRTMNLGSGVVMKLLTTLG